MQKLVTLIARRLRRRPPRPRGRHRAPSPTLTPIKLFMTPWTTPTPPHVLERQRPPRAEDVALVRPYALLDDTLQLHVLRAAAHGSRT
ncbi:hypothetical protein [Streptomyces sp. NPDC047315]|uniref:hypothetical protein n=1 Tax=Streptomyces sp. NPDC047315 TaxID=3155142 RepID=UPI0033D9B3FA